MLKFHHDDEEEEDYLHRRIVKNFLSMRNKANIPFTIMNNCIWSITMCTILFVMMYNFGIMNANPANNPKTVTTAPHKAPAPTVAKPAQAAPTNAPATTVNKYPAPPTFIGITEPSSPTAANSTRVLKTTTVKPHDERGVLAAAAAP
ncbi:unnamed protein product [Schistosoma turkestanicum]|nr:unnamed protein product [Schistosoma turkestanicum]